MCVSLLRSVWWALAPAQPVRDASGNPVIQTYGLLITRVGTLFFFYFVSLTHTHQEGEVTSGQLMIEVTTQCRACPVCPPCHRCVNYECVPICNNPCAPCVGDVCTPTICSDRCAACDARSGQCVPAVVCDNKCTQCNPSNGQCDTPIAITCDQCSMCNPNTGACMDDITKFTACTDVDKCSTCNRNAGGCQVDLAKTTCDDKCTKCNPTNGVCDVPLTTCDSNMCYKVPPLTPSHFLDLTIVL